MKNSSCFIILISFLLLLLSFKSIEKNLKNIRLISYNNETWSKIANDKGFIQQFKSYLQTSGVKNIDDLAYVINSNKANINEVKQAFKELFKRNTDEIFKTNPNIWKQFDRVDGTGKINSLKNFKDLVEDISFDAKHPIFNFIKAE